MSNKDQILDIAMNLNRMGNWAADGFAPRQKRILTFLKQTSDSIKSLEKSEFKQPFAKTFVQFTETYKLLEDQAKTTPVNEIDWAERAMTWGNILTHRAKFI